MRGGRRFYVPKAGTLSSSSGKKKRGGKKGRGSNRPEGGRGSHEVWISRLKTSNVSRRKKKKGKDL